MSKGTLYLPGFNQKGLYDAPLIKGRLTAPYVLSSSVPEAPTLVSITVSPSPGTFRPLASSDTLQLTATGTYSDASTADITTQVTWTSNTAGVATVGSATGLVSPVLAGNASITASLGAINGATLVTVDCDVDGPGTPVRVPANAYQWTLIGQPRPFELWGLQETTGSITGVIQSLVATVNASPAYEVNLPSGWTRKSIELFISNGNAFQRASGTSPDAVQTSVAWMLYGQLTNAAPAGARQIMMGAGTNFSLRQQSGLPRVQCVFGGGLTNGTADYVTDGQVAVFLISNDKTNSRARLHTNKEALTGSFGAFIESVKGLGQGAGTLSTGFRAAYLVCWTGSEAEAVGKTTLQTLRWPTPY